MTMESPIPRSNRCTIRGDVSGQVAVGNGITQSANLPGPARPSAPPLRCFLSYRRDDSVDSVGRIYDRLVARFGAAHVFKDVDSIPAGADFRSYLLKALHGCQVVLAVIGPRWLTIADATGKRRLDDPRDVVRLEVETALRGGIPLIPVLVQGASMPAEQALPESLQELAGRSAVPVGRDPHFHGDLDRLIRQMELLPAAR